MQRGNEAEIGDFVGKFENFEETTGFKQNWQNELNFWPRKNTKITKEHEHEDDDDNEDDPPGLAPGLTKMGVPENGE